MSDQAVMTDNKAEVVTKAPILITGAAQRLGRAAAIHFARQGYPVIISYRRERDDLTDLRALGITTLQADFSDVAGIQAFIEQVKQHTM